MHTLYRWQTKCAMCRAEFARPVKILGCGLVICSNCRKKESVQTFIHSKKCTYCEEINLDDK